MESYIYEELEEKEILISSNELSARLHSPRDFDRSWINDVERELRESLSCRFAAVRLPLSYPEEGAALIGSLRVRSRDLYKNLFPCQKAFLFAVSLGEGVDRYLYRLSVRSVSRHFLADAIASALAEAAADLCEKKIKAGLSCRPRFSPGYGDLPLSFQEPLLRMTDAYRRLGIKLGKNLLLSPQKTITAIMGILP